VHERDPDANGGTVAMSPTKQIAMLLRQVVIRVGGFVSLKSFIGLISIVAVAAQPEAGPDKLIEAARYAAFATDSIECRSEKTGDPVHEAIKWTTLAITTARGFRSKDKTEQGLAASFLARQVRYLADLNSQAAALDESFKTINGDIKRFRLVSAMSALTEAKVVKCDARFQVLSAHLDDLNNHVTSLVGRADVLERNDPKGALNLYGEAQRLDVDDVTIPEKAAIAKAAADRNARLKRVRQPPQVSSNASQPAAARRQFGQPESSTPAASAAGTAILATFSVDLYHRNQWCPGALQIGKGWISFTPNSIWASDRMCLGVAAFHTAQGELGSFGSNAFFGAASNGFHIKRKDGGSFNFAGAGVKRSEVFYWLAQGLQMSNETK
jgi:hypothetical protein